MKLMVILIVLTFGISSTAGPGGEHSHGNGHLHGGPVIKATKAQAKGLFHLKRLIKTKKIDATWDKAKFDKAEKKSFAKKKEWVITFKNEKGKKGKKLYIFLKLSGDFVAANFTGQ